MAIILVVPEISTGFIPVEHAVYWTSAQTATYLSPNEIRYSTRATANIFSHNNTQHIYPTCLTCFVLLILKKKMYLHTISYCTFH